MQSFLNVITLQTYTFFTTLTPRLHGRSKRFFRRPYNLNAPRTLSNSQFGVNLQQRITRHYCIQSLNVFNTATFRFTISCQTVSNIKATSCLRLRDRSAGGGNFFPPLQQPSANCMVITLQKTTLRIFNGRKNSTQHRGVFNRPKRRVGGLNSSHESCMHHLPATRPRLLTTTTIFGATKAMRAEKLALGDEGWP